jgi:phosphoribosyl 1,2-cyclic phosphodiesterase
MNIISLNSGSKGNSTLVITHKHNILIDIGYSMKRINQDLLIASGIDLEDISIIFISHQHTDHISAFKTIYNKYQHIIFFTNESVEKAIEEKWGIQDNERVRTLYTESDGNNLTLTPFELNHDVECYGLMVYDKYSKETYVHIADNGKLYDKQLIELIYNKEYYSIESNHDRTLQIQDTKRHEGLKRRVLGFYGHTSNVDAIELAFKLVGDNTKGIIFNHLSEECNNQELAQNIHNNMIAIWGHKTLFKNIRIRYALQSNIVEL